MSSRVERDSSADHGGIQWRDWGSDAFEEADRGGKLVLLDLTATWCHWCHVMDDTTYADEEVARLIRENFVPVRVDIDQRPDISERYNRGGFPTTAFLSSKGETVWGATYVPPADMKRVIRSLLDAKTSGEMDKALSLSRGQRAGPRVGPEARGMPSRDELDDLFGEILDRYDVEHGGFGFEPKFPQPESVDLLTSRYAAGKDPVLAGAVTQTLIGMAEGLYDEVEGGVFRYSVTRDWSVPHYEKMLETNLGYLRNLTRAYVAFGKHGFKELAIGVAGYLIRVLRDHESNLFYGSQDADEGYYSLSARERERRLPPQIDRTLYSGWNALAASVLMEAGPFLERPDLTEAGLATLRGILRTHWNEERGLARHSEGQELYLSEDQVELLGALLTAVESGGVAEFGDIARRLAGSTMAAFAHASGGIGDIIPSAGEVGDLKTPIRSLVTNSKWAHRLALLGSALDTKDLVNEARSVLGSFDIDVVRAHGVFAAPFVAACEATNPAPSVVRVNSTTGRPETSGLWMASKATMDPSTVTLITKADDDSAVVCRDNVCSRRITRADELTSKIREGASGQL